MAANSKSWQMNLPTAAGIWAAIVILAGFFGMRLGYGGRAFALALGVAAALFAFELFFAAPSVLEQARHSLGERGGVLAPLVPLFAVLIYTIGVTDELENGAARRRLRGAAGAASRQQRRQPAGQWQDYAAVLLIWLPVEFRWKYSPVPLSAATDAHAHNPAGAEHGRRGVRAASASGRNRLRGGMATRLRLECALPLRIFAMIAVALGLRIGFLTYEPSPRACVPRRLNRRDFIFHRVAGGIPVSRGPAKSSFSARSKISGRA